MRYLLDSNAWIALIRRRPARLVARYTATPAADVLYSSVVRGELDYGVACHPVPAQEQVRVDAVLFGHRCLAYDESSAQLFGSIKRAVDRTGFPAGDADLQIAATALVHGLIVVTHNTRDFRNVPGLTIEDWEV